MFYQCLWRSDLVQYGQFTLFLWCFFISLLLLQVKVVLRARLSGAVFLDIPYIDKSSRRLLITASASQTRLSA